jgi:DNA modification methylase
MPYVPDNSVNLVVTSPPYPMIEMWDDLMGELNPDIAIALQNEDGGLAFDLMHLELERVWDALDKAVKPGGIVCINVGDATRTMAGEFQLFSNHSRILRYFLSKGYSNLPNIIWRKQTNAPNKFMGSGTLPPGAYVTLEHEYILIFRKGGKRQFSTDEDKRNRNRSAFFWEERNIWFSDVWDFKGTSQKLNRASLRERSGAFPLELAYRLVNMFSVKGDIVLDPFLGTGTTVLAAMASARNSIGYEIDPSFEPVVFEFADERVIDLLNNVLRDRILKHIKFVKDKQKGGSVLRHSNENYHFPVMSRQETEIIINFIASVERSPATSAFVVEYSEQPLLDIYLKDSLFAVPSDVPKPSLEDLIPLP